MPMFVDEKAFIKATNLRKFKLEGAAKPLMRLTGFTRLNALYQECYSQKGVAFIEAVFKKLEIDLVFHQKELRHLPRRGPFVTIANHPFGMIDSLALLYLILQQREDYKMTADELLMQLHPIQQHLLPKPVLNQMKTTSYGSDDLHTIKQHLAEEHPLGIFPSEELSEVNMDKERKKLTVGGWHLPSISFIHEIKVPVVPVYFHANQYTFFHILRKLNPSFRTMALPAELLGNQNQRIKIRIGNPIPVHEQNRFESYVQLGQYLKARTYSLGMVKEERKVFPGTLKLQRPAKPIAAPTSQTAVNKELAQLLARGKMICHQMEYQAFITRASDIPNILQEIGRLREITFRAVGEGTNQGLDLDEYDQYYLHLFLWDEAEKRIAGAYRMGLGEEIMAKNGKSGFYLSSLFKIADEFIPILHQGIELGRSFVTKPYQAKRLPLFLLWKAISVFLEHHPAYTYLFGPVSISNQYSTLSKTVMVAFLKKYYFDHELAAMVKPRKRFKPKLHKSYMNKLLERTTKDLKEVDRIIEDIEPAHFRLPILLKKYIKQNARIIGFNIDPAFNQALDGFMVMDLKELPESTIQGFKRNEEK